MLKKVKQSKSEKILLTFLTLLAFFSISSFFVIKNKCLFVENIDIKKINFKQPENISIMNINCGNVVIELMPEISPNSVKRFKTFIEKKEYDNVAFHRVIDGFLVQAGDLEFGKKGNLNYTYIGSGKSKYSLIKPEINKPFDFKKGSVGFAKSKNGDMEDSEFFILLSDAPLFEGEYTPLGKVTHGFGALTKINSGNKSEYVVRPDFINSIRMLPEISN